jgi:hypothetical protein
MRFTGAASAVGLAALLLAGCGPAPSTKGPDATPPNVVPPQGTPPQGAPPPAATPLNIADRDKAANELKQIGLACLSCIDSTGKPPSKKEDLYPFLDGSQTSPSQGLASGKYVLFYNVGPLQMTQGSSNTVLGYWKGVPAVGGPVLMGDCSVKPNMPADDFRNAPKAGK